MEKEIEEIKVIFLHESGAGASIIINVAIGLKFDIVPSTTSAYSKEYNFILNGKKYILFLWDTAGQEFFRNLTKIFIKDSKIVIFVYDITDSDSFKELNFWISTAKENFRG